MELGDAGEDDTGAEIVFDATPPHTLAPASARAVDASHPKTVAKRRCRQCTESVKSGAGQKARKDKLYSVTA